MLASNIGSLLSCFAQVQCLSRFCSTSTTSINTSTILKAHFPSRLTSRVIFHGPIWRRRSSSLRQLSTWCGWWWCHTHLSMYRLLLESLWISELTSLLSGTSATRLLLLPSANYAQVINDQFSLFVYGTDLTDVDFALLLTSRSVGLRLILCQLRFVLHWWRHTIIDFC